MLTIHTPIELTVNPSMLQLNDNFTERITGNYKILGARLEPEDMLHFLSEPPEIYLAEGGMTSLVNNQNNVENRTLKMDVINNVLNRILVSDTYHMTYQDEVFITSILKKIGVTDVQEFIRQVQNVKQEMKNTTQLTDLYWSQSEALSQLLEFRQEQAKQEKSPETEAETAESPVFWLQQEIMNRLQTGVIYQELRNYISNSLHQSSLIGGAEMQISEQTITAQQILLNKLKNYTTTEEQPLVYHYLNTYEMGDEIQVEESHDQVVSQMVQAVLLNALHQMYAIRTEELLRQDNVWYQLAGAVYQAAENTYQRFDAYHEQHTLSKKDADSYTRTVQQYQKKEIQAIQQFFAEQENNITRYSTEINPPGAELNYIVQEGEDEEVQPDFQNRQQTTGEERREQSQPHGQQIQNITRQEILLKQQLEQINQNNIQNSQLLQQIIERPAENREVPRINREAARKDGLRALTQPREVLMEYLETQTHEEQQRETIHEELTRVFGERTVRILETLEKYQKTPELVTASGQVVPDAAGMLVRDIQFQNLENQTELVHRTEERSQETVHDIQTRELLKEYLPEQVRQVQQTTKRNVERVELLHREQETNLEEEVLEEIRGLQRTTRVENQQTIQQTIERNTTQEVINHRVNEFQTRQNEELVRLIDEKVQRQLGDISEQVYGKLEKRMDTERRRRGL